MWSRIVLAEALSQHLQLSQDVESGAVEIVHTGPFTSNPLNYVC